MALILFMDEKFDDFDDWVNTGDPLWVISSGEAYHASVSNEDGSAIKTVNLPPLANNYFEVYWSNRYNNFYGNAATHDAEIRLWFDDDSVITFGFSPYGDADLSIWYLQATNYEVSLYPNNRQLWTKLVSEIGAGNNRTVSLYYNYTQDSKTKPTSWTLAGTQNIANLSSELANVTIRVNNKQIGADFNYHWFDDIQIYVDTTSSVVGFDPSIEYEASYLRTAFNAEGSGKVTAPSPFYAPVSAATFKDQQKKLLTYTNAFGRIQWQGEGGALKFSIHGAEFEVEECLKKTQYVEVGQSPVILHMPIRQVQGLVIVDKDAGFVSRGVTADHLVSFEKADKKVFEARSDSNTFSVVDTNFVTPFVPNIVSNGKDEEMYYKDKWDSIDTDKAHIVIQTGRLDFFAVRYPVNLYEKFNNLTKLNKLEIVTTISAISFGTTGWTNVGGDDGKYWYYLYNYHILDWEVIDKFGRSDLGNGAKTVSTADGSGNSKFYDAIEITVNVIELLKAGESNWDISENYVIGDRAIHEDVLYTALTIHSGTEPPDETDWQRTVYDFINYESEAGTDSEFSKLNTIPLIRTTKTKQTEVDGGTATNGFWMWAFSIRATFDEDNEPEYSSASIATVAGDGKSITLLPTSGKNLPYEDGFGIGDIIHIVKLAQDYLQDAWDANQIKTDIGALIIDVTKSVVVTEDHTYKSFFTLMQHICGLTNSTFFPVYGATRTVKMVSADNHIDSGIIFTKKDLVGYNAGNWSITYDPTKQRNKIRIIGDNVNIVKNLSPTNGPFDLGDEIETIEDSDIQTSLQASDKADALAPRMEDSEVIAIITLNYTKVPSGSNYTNVKIGSEASLLLPLASDTSTANFQSGGDGRLVIAAIELNNNKDTGWQDHVTIMLQKRYV